MGTTDSTARLTTLWRRRHELFAVSAFAREVLARPLNGDLSRGVHARMARRHDAFLEMLERVVFATPGHPYRTLLQQSGHGIQNIRALIAERGLDAALEQLAHDGVYISIDEFKGRRPIERNGVTLNVSDADFANPLVRAGLLASSGGSRSQGIPTLIPAANLRLGAEHLALALEAYGLREAAAAVWLPLAHGASLWAILALSLVGQIPQEWFAQFSAGIDPSGQGYARYWGLRLGGHLAGVRLPRARHVPVGSEADVLPLLSRVRRPWVIFTTPSFAIRLALAAQRAGARLDRVTFLTIGEPLTRAKAAALEVVGARAYSSLGFTEFGRATYGCARPAALDDGHVCLDAVAVIQRDRPVDRVGSVVPALLFTALLPDSRKVLINMETGDYAALSHRSCGCPLERLGWRSHLQDIRSFEKLNAEGVVFFGSDLITLVEEVLPRRFGGDPTDYQLVEHEDRGGITRLAIRIHPRLPAIDEHAVRQCVETVLMSEHELSTKIWSTNGTLAVERAEPIVTRAGKSLALHHLA